MFVEHGLAWRSRQPSHAAENFSAAASPHWRTAIGAPVIAGLLQLGSMASTASAQTLNEAQDWSLRSSISIQADNARQEVAVARLRGSIDAFMPSVAYLNERILDSKIKYAPEYQIPTETGIDSVARRAPNASGLVVSLPLFDGFKRYNNFRSASLGLEAGKFLQLDKRQQVLLDASTAYISVIRDRKIVELRRRQVADISTIAVRTKARFSVRDATLTDVDIANSRVLAAQIALEQSMADLTSSNIDYTRITGSEPQALTEPGVPNGLIPATVQEFQDTLRRINPRLQANRLDATAAGYIAKAQFAEVLPQVNLVAHRLQQTNISDALNKATEETVKVQMRVPLYEPGAMSRISETRALAKQKSWEALDSEREGVAAGASLYQSRVSTINQIERTNARVKSIQRAVNGYGIEQSAGFRTIIDVLNARSELTEAQVAKANLEFARDKQTFTLAAALARLGATPVEPSPLQLPQPQLQLPPATLVSALR